MVYDIQKVIDVALSEVSYVEKASNKQLDSKTANAGSSNYTKYARDLDANRFFNGAKQGHAWCAVFVAWCFYKAYGKDAALKLLCQPSSGNCGAGCKYAMRYFELKGRLRKTKPQKGDVIYFRSSDGSTISHTGIVYNVDSSRVYTVEGNTSSTSGVIDNGGCVCKKSYALTNSRIAGYGMPVFGTKTASESSEQKHGQIYSHISEGASEGKIEGKSVDISLSTLKTGSRGNQVRTVQRLLNAMGYSCGTVDGDFGSKTLASVKSFQRGVGLEVDGIIGAKTWGKLLK